MNQVDIQEIPQAAGLRSHYIGALNTGLAGSKVAICGWVSRIREQGKQLIFIDVRDFTGVVQCVLPLREDIRSETVVRVRATVSLRPEGTENLSQEERGSNSDRSSASRGRPSVK